MSSQTHSPQVQIALDFFEANSSLNLDKSASLLTDDFTYNLLPKSLNGKTTSKADFLESVKQFVPLFSFLNVRYYTHTYRFIR